MAEQKREKPSLKRILVWFAGVVILVVGGYWMKLAADTATSMSDPQFMWVYYGGVTVLLGVGVMIYSRLALK